MAIPPDRPRRFGKAIDRLWLVFKLGAVFSAGFLVVGTIVIWLLHREQRLTDVPPWISAVTKAGLALAFLGLVIASVLEGYTYFRTARQSLQMRIRGLLGNLVMVAIAGALVVVMAAGAVHDFSK